MEGQLEEEGKTATDRQETNSNGGSAHEYDYDNEVPLDEEDLAYLEEERRKLKEEEQKQTQNFLLESQALTQEEEMYYHALADAHQ